MLCRQRIAVVVPARNEANHIGRVLQTMPHFVDAIVVVDDGSDDETIARTRHHGDRRLQIVQHAQTQGVGAALRSGYHAAFGAGADVAAVMAGDGQMDPNDLQRLLTPVLEGRAGYAKGNRFNHGDLRAMPMLRRWGGRVLSMLTRWVTGLSVDDSQCGYTAISRTAHARVPWPDVWSGYGYPNDLLAWLALRNVTVCDVCVRPIYADEASGLRLRHATITIPWLLARATVRRIARALSSPLSATLRPTQVPDSDSGMRKPNPESLQ